MEDGRKEYDAMIEAAVAFVETPVSTLHVCAAAWDLAGRWTPTEQHETVTAMLVELNEKAKRLPRRELGELTGAWVDAGKPGLPKPADPYGPIITVDTGGRCPVEGSEVVKWRLEEGSWCEHKAGDLSWTWETQFRRILADHPGDTYWHGKPETIPESGKAGLDVREKVVTHSGTWRYAHEVLLIPGDNFRRWLKGDA